MRPPQPPANWPRQPNWCAAGSTDDERSMWAFDPWDSAAAEVASAINVGHRRASGPHETVAHRPDSCFKPQVRV